MKEMCMNMDIEVLNPADFEKCAEIWDIKGQADLAKRFQSELRSGSRATWLCRQGGAYVGEISLVFDMKDPDYTLKGRRAYVSHLIVKKEARRRGIGTALLDFAVEQARKLSYCELSVGVDLNNEPALKLYTAAGFDKILFSGEDSQGKYVKLLKTI